MVFKGEEMNLGFYVDDCGGSPRNETIYNFLNSNIANLDDASVFFNNVNFNPITPRFGLFDATEIWHFTGNLICTTLENFVKANAVANKFKPCYLFDTSDKTQGNLFNLIKVAKSGAKVLVDNPISEKEFYRVTGVRPKKIDFSVDNFKEIFDE
jgi:hypothetical protein